MGRWGHENQRLKFEAANAMFKGIHFPQESIIISVIHLPAPIITDGLLVFVQLVMAAMTTEPCDNAYSAPSNWNGTDVDSLSSLKPKP